jgi:hypothetical protein
LGLIFSTNLSKKFARKLFGGNRESLKSTPGHKAAPVLLQDDSGGVAQSCVTQLQQAPACVMHAPASLYGRGRRVTPGQFGGKSFARQKSVKIEQ